MNYSDEIDCKLALLFSFLVPIGWIIHFVVIVGSDEVVSLLLGLGFRLHQLLVVGPFLRHGLPEIFSKQGEPRRR